MAHIFPFDFWVFFVAFHRLLIFFLFQVMDYNINLGKHLLPLVVQVLKYCSCPQLRHYFQQPPRCSLWSLKPHIRQMWLKALLVILYKVSWVVTAVLDAMVLLESMQHKENTWVFSWKFCRIKVWPSEGRSGCAITVKNQRAIEMKIEMGGPVDTCSKNV